MVTGIYIGVLVAKDTVPMGNREQVKTEVEQLTFGEEDKSVSGML